MCAILSPQVQGDLLWQPQETDTLVYNRALRKALPGQGETWLYAEVSMGC